MVAITSWLALPFRESPASSVVGIALVLVLFVMTYFLHLGPILVVMLAAAVGILIF